MLIHLTNEADVRELLGQKKTSSFVLLYHSIFDKYSKRIINKADKWAEHTGKDIYCISNWDLPEAFAAFQVMSSPTIVEVRKGKVTMHIEYPKVYDYFEVKP